VFKFIRILFIIIIGGGGAVGGSGYWLYQHKLVTPLPIINDRYYTVKPQANLGEVAIDLMAAGWLDYPSALTWVMLARWQRRAHLIKAGRYRLSFGLTPQGLLDQFIQGPQRDRGH
jgi:UPF0755 protein